MCTVVFVSMVYIYIYIINEIHVQDKHSRFIFGESDIRASKSTRLMKIIWKNLIILCLQCPLDKINIGLKSRIRSCEEVNLVRFYRPGTKLLYII